MKSIASSQEINELAQFLAVDIPAHAQAPNPGAWTAAVFGALAKLANERSWKLYPEERPYKGEYLTDFMLLKMVTDLGSRANPNGSIPVAITWEIYPGHSTSYVE